MPGYLLLCMSEKVIDLILNAVALEFIFEIDDLIVKAMLAKKEYRMLGQWRFATPVGLLKVVSKRVGCVNARFSDKVRRPCGGWRARDWLRTGGGRSCGAQYHLQSLCCRPAPTHPRLYFSCAPMASSLMEGRGACVKPFVLPRDLRCSPRYLDAMCTVQVCRCAPPRSMVDMHVCRRPVLTRSWRLDWHDLPYAHRCAGSR